MKQEPSRIPFNSWINKSPDNFFWKWKQELRAGITQVWTDWTFDFLCKSSRTDRNLQSLHNISLDAVVLWVKRLSNVFGKSHFFFNYNKWNAACKAKQSQLTWKTPSPPSHTTHSLLIIFVFFWFFLLGFFFCHSCRKFASHRSGFQPRF